MNLAPASVEQAMELFTKIETYVALAPVERDKAGNECREVTLTAEQIAIAALRLSNHGVEQPRAIVIGACLTLGDIAADDSCFFPSLVNNDIVIKSGNIERTYTVWMYDNEPPSLDKRITLDDRPILDEPLIDPDPETRIQQVISRLINAHDLEIELGFNIVSADEADDLIALISELI